MPRKLFQKGQSGNPGGRPKEFKPFRAIVTPEMAALAEASLLHHLEKKDPKVTMWFYDQCHGKPAQPLTGGDGGPVAVTFVENLPE